MNFHSYVCSNHDWLQLMMLPLVLSFQPRLPKTRPRGKRRRRSKPRALASSRLRAIQPHRDPCPSNNNLHSNSSNYSNSRTVEATQRARRTRRRKLGPPSRAVKSSSWRSSSKSRSTCHPAREPRWQSSWMSQKRRLVCWCLFPPFITSWVLELDK